MHLGFTGTQQGMTEDQMTAVMRALQLLKPTHAHHGDCIGADAEFHGLVRGYVPTCRIIGHPPTKQDKRAFCDFDEVRPEAPYLTRNKHIVNECELLLATPDGFVEKRRSGTWSTIRYADGRRQRMVIKPDGSSELDLWAYLRLLHGN